MSVSSERWKMLAEWAAETESIDPSRPTAWSSELAEGHGREERTIRAPDAERAVEILDQAIALGFFCLTLCRLEARKLHFVAWIGNR